MEDQPRKTRGMWADPTMTKEDASAIAKAIGARGGAATRGVRTEKKAASSRRNGMLGGSPKGTMKLRTFAMKLAGWPPDMPTLSRLLWAADEILPEGRATRGRLSAAQMSALQAKLGDPPR